MILGFPVDTFVLCKVGSKTKHFFIHLLVVSELVVVVILSGWWLVTTTANHCEHIHEREIESLRERFNEFSCKFK